MTINAVTMLIGVFSPWLRSGSSTRSSFELFELVERLGFASGGTFYWAVRGWPLVPLVTTAAVIASWSGLSRASAGLSTLAGVYVGAVAVGVRRAPNAGLIRTEWGVTVSLAGAVLLIATAVWTLVEVNRSRDRARRTPA